MKGIKSTFEGYIEGVKIHEGLVYATIACQKSTYPELTKENVEVLNDILTQALRTNSVKLLNDGAVKIIEGWRFNEKV